MGVAQALTAFTQVLTGATKAVSVSSTQGMSTPSPARLIESRSKLQSECATEKETIMDLLKQLKGN